jgi:hypothetical protein
MSGDPTLRNPSQGILKALDPIARGHSTATLQLGALLRDDLLQMF